ncbi:glycosyltransferase [Streptomyces sp. MS1.AVA.3]|uniref:glycosyltransferase n=1 Tax=Streptomyces decoyicus TaxID=249567 RepID=UPI0030C2581D
MGRIDETESPHLAIRAAQILRRRIRIVGPVFDHTYIHRHEKLFAADHVEWTGELGGPAKTAAFRNAAASVYTYARPYEAGAAVFGESLRAGTPISALAWRKGTCAEAALCEKTGVVTGISPEEDDESAAHSLASAIEVLSHDHAQVQDIGQQRFDLADHFDALATRPC